MNFAPAPLSVNPFSLLSTDIENADVYIEDQKSNSVFAPHREVDFDHLSISSWSVVNSDGEEDDCESGNDSDEIYFDHTGSNATENGSSSSEPLTVSLKNDDDFAHISKTLFTHSINGPVAAANHGSWVVKVSKQRRPSPVPSPSNNADSPLTTSEVVEDLYDSNESLEDHELAKSVRATNLRNVRVAHKANLILYRDLHLEVKRNQQPDVYKGYRAPSTNSRRMEMKKGVSIHQSQW